MSDISQAKTASVATFITALVTNCAVFAVEIAIFTLIRPHFKAIYQPRTYIPIASKRIGAISHSLFAWPLAVYNADHNEIRRLNGIDAYVFVHFLRMMVKILLPIWALSWVILLPVNAVRHPVGMKGLDRFTFGNISTDNQPRYAAHLILVYIFTFWIFYVVKEEMRDFITVRQRYLIDKHYSQTAQASTVLITGVPTRYLQPSALRALLAPLPGGIKNIWVNRDLKDIPDLYDERASAVNKLESAETSLINTAVKRELKKQKLIAKGKTPKPDPDTEADSSNSDPERTPPFADKLVPRKDRPTHRLKPFSWLPFGLPFMGKKVDTIEWCREEIARLNAELETRQGNVATEMAKEKITTEEETYPRLNSAFIRFNQQVAAQMAAQTLMHHEPYRMGDKYNDVAPEDVIWSNLDMNPYEGKIRTAISYAATAGLILLWAIPVTFVGFVSNIHSLCATYSWLAWICTLPSVVVGIISGLLPPVLLAVLMMLLPIILRMLAQFEGIPRRTGVELSLMTRFFIFQVIHSFLIVTISAGIIQALPGIVNNLSSVPSLLANNLPGASTFFLTYILLQLSGIAAGFLQIVPLIIYYVKLFLLGSTPRSVYTIKNTMRSVQWGTLFPGVTLLVVITLAYSVISPIINGLACAAFFLQYQMWKYQFTWQLDQKPSSDTGGLFFPKAITHIFVGMYVEQVCLAALFFLARDSNHKASAIPEGALMIVLIVITAGFHLILIDSYGPLLHALPLSLVERANDESEPLLLESPTGEKTPLRDPEDNFSGEGEPAPARSSSIHRKPVPESHEMGTVNNGRTVKSEAIDSDASVLGSQSQANSEAQAHQAEAGRSSDFDHPALGPARIVWIPRDALGLGEAEEADTRAAGVAVSSEGAVMNEKGTVDVSNAPPGEKLTN